MLSYRDMTFCPFWRNCSSADNCDRKLTEDVKVRAGVAGLDISQYCSPPACHCELKMLDPSGS